MVAKRLHKHCLFPVAVLLAFFLVPSQILQAETIYMNDGRTIEGKIVNETDDHLEVATDHGYLTLDRKNVVSVKQEKSNLPRLGDLLQSDPQEPATEKEPSEAEGEPSNAEQRDAPSPAAIEESGATPEDGEQNMAPLTRGKAFFHSAIWPGWGQFKQKRGVWGTVYSLGFATGIANYAYAELESQQKRIYYENESESFYNQVYANQSSLDPTLFWFQFGQVIGARRAYSKSIESANRAGLLLLGIYGANLIDVVWHHPESDSLKSESLGLFLQPDGGSMSYTWRF